MNRKIIGATVGTPINPQAIIEKANINFKADSIINSATGKTILTTDSANAPLVNLKAKGDTWQKQYEGHQLFDISQLTLNTAVDNNGEITEIGENYIVVTTTDKHTGNGYCKTGKKLREVCPDLVVGETYLLTATTDSTAKSFYVGTLWQFGKTMTITEEMLNENFIVYGFDYINAKQYGACKISDITIVKGTVEKPWEKYVGGQPSPNMEYEQPIVSAGQKLLEGNQLFDVNLIKTQSSNGITANIDNDVITLSGTNANTAYIEFDLPKVIPTGTKITFTLDNDSRNTNVAIRLNSNGVSDGNTYFTLDKANKKITTTTSKDCDSLSILVSPTTINMLFKIMLSEDENAEYKPYTGGVEKVVDVGVEVKVLSGNFFDVNAFVNLPSNSDYYGVDSDGNLINIQADYRPDNTLPVFATLPKGKYTLSGYTGKIQGMKIVWGEDLTNILFDNGTFELTEETELRIKVFNGANVNCGKLMLNIGTVAIPFTPYKESQTLTIPYALRSVGSHRDYVDFKSGKLYQYCPEYTIDENSNIMRNTSAKEFYIPYFLPHVMTYRQGFCNALKVNTVLDSNVTSMLLGAKNDFVYLIKNPYWDDSLADSGIANLKAHLKEHPLKIVTYLDEPIITDLTEEELEVYRQLHTNYPTTTILSNAELEVEYVADTKNYIDNKFKELEANVTSAIAQLL